MKRALPLEGGVRSKGPRTRTKHNKERRGDGRDLPQPPLQTPPPRQHLPRQRIIHLVLITPYRPKIRRYPPPSLAAKHIRRQVRVRSIRSLRHSPSREADGRRHREK